MNFRLFYCIALFTGLLLSTSFVLAANITGSYKYAWSNNVGYINFENLTVGNTTLSGYVWSTNKGWIKFDPTNGGVSNNGQGVLSGYAWGEQLGWINFSGVSINTSTGKFSGTATSDLIGTLTFDCPTYCDVRTDWRPVTPVPTPSSGGGGGGGYIPPTPIPTPTPTLQTITPVTTPTLGPTSATVPVFEPVPSIFKTNTLAIPGISKSEPTLETSNSIRDHITEFYKTIDKLEPAIRKETKYVENYNMPLVITPEQTGLLVWDFSTAEMTRVKQKQAVSIELSRSISTSKITLFIDQTVAELLPSLDQASVLGAVFDITAKDDRGNRVHEFSAPLKITLIVPEDLRGRKDLGVYYFADSASEWAYIPEALFDNISATFYVNHLARFAIFALKPDFLTKNGVPPETLAASLHTSSRLFMWLYGIVGMLSIIWLSRRIRKRN